MEEILTELEAVMLSSEVRERGDRRMARRVMSVSDVAATADLCQLRVVAVNIMLNQSALQNHTKHYCGNILT